MLSRVIAAPLSAHQQLSPVHCRRRLQMASAMAALSRTMGKLAQLYASGRDPSVTQVSPDAAKSCCASRSPSLWTHRAFCSPQVRLPCSCSISVRLGSPCDADLRVYTSALRHDHTRGDDRERTSRSAGSFPALAGPRDGTTTATLAIAAAAQSPGTQCQLGTSPLAGIATGASGEGIAVWAAANAAVPPLASGAVRTSQTCPSGLNIHPMVKGLPGSRSCLQNTPPVPDEPCL